MEYRWINDQLGEEGPLCKKDPGHQYEFCGYQLRNPQIMHISDYDKFFENIDIRILNELDEQVEWNWIKIQAKVLTYEQDRIKFYDINKHLVAHLEMPFYGVFWSDREGFPFVSNRYWGI